MTRINRSRNFSIRFSEPEWREINRVSEQLGLSISETIRHLLFDFSYSQEEKPEPTIDIKIQKKERKYEG